jgi:hypothetical protein
VDTEDTEFLTWARATNHFFDMVPDVPQAQLKGYVETIIALMAQYIEVKGDYLILLRQGIAE